MKGLIVFLFSISPLLSIGQDADKKSDSSSSSGVWPNFSPFEIPDSAKYVSLKVIFDVQTNERGEVIKVDLNKDSDSVSDLTIEKFKKQIFKLNFIAPKNSTPQPITNGKMTFYVVNEKKKEE